MNALVLLGLIWLLAALVLVALRGRGRSLGPRTRALAGWTVAVWLVRAPAIALALMRAIAKAPGARFSTASEFVAALGEVQTTPSGDRRQTTAFQSHPTS